jgi:hypothetical protein
MEFVISPIKTKDKLLWAPGRIHILYIILRTVIARHRYGKEVVILVCLEDTPDTSSL